MHCNNFYTFYDVFVLDCEQTNGIYCGQLQTQPDFNIAAVGCLFNCTSIECITSISKVNKEIEYLYISIPEYQF